MHTPTRRALALITLLAAVTTGHALLAAPAPADPPYPYQNPSADAPAATDATPADTVGSGPTDADEGSGPEAAVPVAVVRERVPGLISVVPTPDLIYGKAVGPYCAKIYAFRDNPAALKAFFDAYYAFLGAVQRNQIKARNEAFKTVLQSEIGRALKWEYRDYLANAFPKIPALFDMRATLSACGTNIDAILANTRMLGLGGLVVRGLDADLKPFAGSFTTIKSRSDASLSIPNAGDWQNAIRATPPTRLTHCVATPNRTGTAATCTCTYGTFTLAAPLAPPPKRPAPAPDFAKACKNFELDFAQTGSGT